MHSMQLENNNQRLRTRTQSKSCALYTTKPKKSKTYLETQTESGAEQVFSIDLESMQTSSVLMDAVYCKTETNTSMQ